MQRAFLISGLLTLAGAWIGPLPKLAQGAFYAHMIMHMLVVALAAPLIALGLAGTRFDPARKFPRLFAPVALSLMELFVVWAWHAPALHHAARHTTSGVIAEQGTFLVAGLLVWLSALGGAPRANSDRRGAGVIALLLTSMHMTLLGALLALTPRPLYGHAGVLTSLSPLADQQLGGAIMIVVGGVAYLLGGLSLTAALLRRMPLKETHA
jgi:putative membrane protein